MKALIPILELGEAVERSAAGIPRAWRLLKNGENAFTLKGEDATLTLGEKEFRAIVDYHRKKGCKIPIDSRHFVSHLATKLKRDESEILKLLPDGTATMGFGNLELRPDGLWLSEAEFVPAAAEMLRAGTIKYFSPTIRGLDGSEPLRVTSVAFDNEPCLNGIPELTKTLSLAELSSAIEQLTEEAFMADETKKTADPAVVQQRDAVVREVLQLSENDSPETVRGKLVALQTQANLVPELNAKVEALELAEEQRSRAAALQNLLATGRLTNAMAESEYFRKMSSAELSEYGKTVPEKSFVNTGKLVEPEKRPEAEPRRSKVYENLGLTEAEMKQCK